MATKNTKVGSKNQPLKKETTAKSGTQVTPVTDTTVQSAGASKEGVSLDLAASQSGTLSDDKEEKRTNIAGLSVQSKQAGFRRAGRAWTTEPTFVALAELTDEEITALEEEPLLIVTRTEA